MVNILLILMLAAGGGNPSSPFYALVQAMEAASTNTTLHPGIVRAPNQGVRR